MGMLDCQLCAKAGWPRTSACVQSRAVAFSEADIRGPPLLSAETGAGCLLPVVEPNSVLCLSAASGALWGVAN